MLLSFPTSSMNINESLSQITLSGIVAIANLLRSAILLSDDLLSPSLFEYSLLANEDEVRDSSSTLAFLFFASILTGVRQMTKGTEYEYPFRRFAFWEYSKKE